MQRWTSVLVGAFLVAIIGALLWKGDRSNPAAAASSRDGGAETLKGEREAGVLDDPIVGFLQAEGGITLGLTEAVDADTPGSGLPTGAPKMVRFGVILVQYRGAQAAPASSRTKDEALSLAKSLAEAAKVDFKAQVAKGDPGSMDDAGKIPRGVLEPASEFALFTMSPGSTSSPIDTPRGFWIVRRIE
jgi:PPIC-type PPIASE domain